MSYPALEGLYSIHDELGSGGFGKVKLAVHLLTGLKVAIKIIDKKAIGDDLPRVTTELDALKTLSHQNICRLYQFIDTEDKFFIIMEYCSGGEMFDYIVRKERLEESEARHFFRQLVQAMAYVHSMGYAHRDLKPENLLLTEDLHLKVIDFGLCAKPSSLSRPLDTCCGSPAYAAPELIAGKAYLGNEADIWSMGVLLYALLCGSLPFEDENMQLLYQFHTICFTGNYSEPEWLSPSSRTLLRSMLQVNPQYRITVKQLLDHPWINYKYSQKLKWSSIYDVWFFISDRTASIHQSYQFFRRMLLMRKYLFFKGKKPLDVLLFADTETQGIFQGDSQVMGSPTIHASLEHNLDCSGCDDSPDVDLSPRSFRSGSSISEQFDAMWRNIQRDRAGDMELERLPRRGIDVSFASKHGIELTTAFVLGATSNYVATRALVCATQHCIQKLKNDSPQVLKTVDGRINVSVTNSTDPERIKYELIKVFEQQNIKYELNGWKISGKQKDKAGHALTVELEVVVVENIGKVSLHFIMVYRFGLVNSFFGTEFRLVSEEGV
ncbi:unnamed protein product [Angiostrongylus costaricensis]|uniref:non-specific serine/threonine protein kinase n=1 Tax=Angiostrongylus costaricensis TaxID=334426 RepID=A0A158PLH8_ANGCS|nr:unnamed protein product [Angiostrongylus costaricensis]